LDQIPLKLPTFSRHGSYVLAILESRAENTNVALSSAVTRGPKAQPTIVVTLDLSSAKPGPCGGWPHSGQSNRQRIYNRSGCAPTQFTGEILRTPLCRSPHICEARGQLFALGNKLPRERCDYALGTRLFSALNDAPLRHELLIFVESSTSTNWNVPRRSGKPFDVAGFILS
jgi:hypothetical protein